MNDTLRAADQDREETVGLLREHYAQGRLTVEKFDERSTAAYAARTMGELRPLLEDLPAADRRPAPAGNAWSPARTRGIAAAAVLAAVGLVVVGVVVVGVVAGHALFAVPTWLLIIVAVKVAHGRREVGHREERDRRGPGRVRTLP